MKTKRKSLIIQVLFAALVSVFTLGLVSCGEKKPNDYGETGVYYFDAETEEYLITLSSGNSVSLYIDGEDVSGSYSYDGSALTFSFDGEEEVVEATLANNVITMEYDDASYRFLKKIKYSVAYELDGGEGVESGSVTNGKTLAKPADPTKEGYKFVGWYEDSKFTMPFAFGVTPVLSDITLYARFVSATAGQSEYTVTFVDGETKLGETETVGGVVFGTDEFIPEKEGETFLGWWISDYETEARLTAEYTNQVLDENTTFYAVWQSAKPAVSVDDNGITWSAEGVTNTYTVEVKKSGTTLVSYESSAMSYAYNFAAQPAGDYEVTVTVNGGEATTVYYKNKALARVSHFYVAEPSMLIFEGVENAEKYLITVSCGDENHAHSHTAIDNGTSTNYPFANCEMKEGGIEFTVQAVAEGYATSTSAVFKYTRDLAPVTGLALNQAGDKVTWNSVKNATSYVVNVGGEEYTVKTTSFSVKAYSGDVTVAVTPVAKGYNSPAAQEISYTNSRLATPTGISITYQTINWKAVEGATSYLLTFGEKSFTVTDNRYELTEEDFAEGATEYKISVQAIAENEANNSFVSDEFIAKYNEIGVVNYSAGVLSWNPVLGAYRFGVSVNGGVFTKTEAGATSAKVSLTQAGWNEISLCFYDDYETQFAPVTVKVYAYEITLSWEGGNADGEAANVVYKAVGDPMDLPVEGTRRGYDFAGWYNIPGGPANGGAKSPAEATASNAIYYAHWTPKQYTVKLMLDLETVFAEETVSYREYYSFSTLEPEDPTIAFGGWYTAMNRKGTQLTNAEGKSFNVWNTIPAEGEELKVYVGWLEAVDYILSDDGKSYAAVAGGAISRVSVIRIAATRENEETGEILPVTEIKEEGFAAKSSLKTVYLPDTIQTLHYGADGPNEGKGFAFRNCLNLQDIHVYCANEEEHAQHMADGIDGMYFSIDGVLFYENPNEEQKTELLLVPLARTGSYEIPADVSNASVQVTVPETDENGNEIVNTIDTIPTKALSRTKLTEIIIPHTITKIDSFAFKLYLTASLESIIFKAAPEGVEEKTLTLGNGVFSGQTKLMSITIPARIQELNLDPTDTDNFVFKGCSALAAVYVGGSYENQLYKSTEDGILLSADEETLIFAATAFAGKAGVYATPTGVTEIAEYAFYKNKNLTEVTIKATVQTIAKSAFEGCSALTKVDFLGEANDGPLTIETRAFYSCGALTEITLPGNLAHLKQFAFGACSKLVTVYVNAVGAELDFEAGAFVADTDAGTSYVQTVVLSKDTGVIELNGVFGSKVATVDVEDGNSYYTTKDGVVFNKAETEILYYPTAREAEKYDIPTSVTKIGAGVFRNKSFLKEITVPASVTEIGDRAFAESKQLVKVEFAQNGTEELNFGNYVFYNCTALSEINIPTRTRKMGTNIFHYCSSLTSIVIPEGVTELGDAAFERATKLQSVSLPSTLTKLGYVMVDGEETEVMLMFNYSNMLETITVAANNPAYRVVNGVLYGLNEKGEETTLYYSPIKNTGAVVVPATVTKIWDKAFYQNAGVTSVTFEKVENDETVTPDEGTTEGEGETAPATPVFTLGAQVFYSCYALETVELPEGLDIIPKSTFYACEKLTSINIPSTVVTIENGAFSSCDNIETITFAEGGTQPLELGEVSKTDGLFRGFKKLKTVVLPERTKVIGGYTFYECVSLEGINLPSGLESIGGNAFYKTNLGDIVIPDSVTLIDDNAFNKAGLTSLYIGSGLTIIGDTGALSNQNVFANNTELTSVTFSPDSQLTFISGYAFEGCTALETISLPKTLQTIKSRVFAKCTSLEEVIFEVDETTKKASLQKIGSQAFEATALTSFEFPESTSEISLENNIFNKCKQLKEITLSTSITSLATSSGSVLGGCASIERILVAQGHENFAQPEAGATLPFLYDATNKTIVKAYGELKGVVDLSALSITGIDSTAFMGQVNMTKIILPASLEKIGSDAFLGCWDLEEVQFADVTADASLTEIGESAFQYCESLSSFTIPESVTKIGNLAFADTGITSITVPASVATMGTSVFARCVALTSATVNNTTINASQFDACEALESVVMPKVTTIGNYALRQTAITSIIIPEGATSLGTTIFAKCAALTSATVLGDKITNYMFQNCTALKTVNASSVTTIGNYAFDACAELKAPVFGELTSVGNYAFRKSGIVSIDLSKATKLGTYAFQDATNLRSVTLGEGVKTIDQYAFDGCVSLTTIDLSRVETVNQNAFDGCSSLATIDLSSLKKVGGTAAFKGIAITELTLPATLTTVSTNMFENCTSLTTIDIQCAKTGNNMFKGCTALTSVTIPSHWTTIGTNLFENCTGITSITFENTATSNNMFKGCTGLTSVTIPASVTTVGNNLFQNCTGLTSVTLDTTKISNYMFYGCSSLTTVDISKATNLGTAGTYLFQNCTELTSVTINPSTTKLPNYMFSGCTALETVNYPSITTLGTYVFKDCTALESVTFGKVTTITQSCFENCTALTSFDLTNVTTINASAFKKSGLTSVTIPADLTTIHATNPFLGCMNLTSFTVDGGNTVYMAGPNGELCKVDKTIIAYPASVTGVITLPEGFTVARYAFEGCDGITGINIPNGTKAIAQYAFANMKGLVKITVPASVEVINAYAFQNSTELREIVFAEGSKLTEIGAYAFYNTGLVRVVLPDTVTRFGYTSSTSTYITGSVFYNSKQLEYVKLPADLTEIGNSNFYNCAALTTVILPTALDVLATTNFYGCESLASIKLPDALTTINSGAFKNSGIQSLVIPASVTSIGLATGSSGSATVFGGSALREVTFEAVPELLLGAEIFYGAQNLETVNLPEGWTTITQGMFQNCKALQTINLPSTITTFSSYAFQGSGLVEIVLPESLTTTGFWGFKDCENLERVVMNESLTEVGSSCFSGCTALKSIYIPANATASSGVFTDCTALETIYVGASKYETAAWVTSGKAWYSGVTAQIIYDYVPAQA